MPVLGTYPSLAVPFQKPGLVFWLSAYDPNNNGTQNTNNTGVPNWYNKTAFYATSAASQATGGLQPVYKTNILNGKPVINFTSASNQQLQASGSQLAVSPNYAIYALFNLRSGSDVNQTICCKGVFDYILQMNRNTATSKLSFFNGTSWEDSILTFTATNYCIVCATGSASTSQMYANGTSIGSTGPHVNPTTSATNLMVGAQNTSSPANYFNGNLVELLVYQNFHASGDVQSISSFFQQFYGLTF